MGVMGSNEGLWTHPHQEPLAQEKLPILCALSGKECRPDQNTAGDWENQTEIPKVK